MSRYTLTVERLPEFVVPGKRLGRHVRHDSRSLQYRYVSVAQPGQPLQTNMLHRYIGILDQGNVGACTGNAMVGALGTGPLWQGLARAQRSGMNEQTALNIYSLAEVHDGDGPYPPQDNGSSGLSAAWAAQKKGYLNGCTHCFSLQDVLQAIDDGNPVMLGTNWYDSMDSPDGNGLVSISPNAVVRGGHEYLARGSNTDGRLVFMDNSWGAGWGDAGSFTYSWDTLERLLSESGDGTVPVARNAPAPVPVVTPDREYHVVTGEQGPKLVEVVTP